MNGKRDEQIRSRAYAIWEREGRPHGRQEHHWHQAIREVDEGSGDQAATPPETPAASAPLVKTAARAKRTSTPKAEAKPKAPGEPKAPAKPKA